MIETPKEAARRLSAPMLNKGFKPLALHTYTDSEGKPRYWRIRAKHPDTGEKWIRPMKLNGQGYELGEPKFDTGKPLYNLHRIASNADAEVWIVEGEQKADALNKLGLVATTSGGATSADSADWEPLRGHSVIIWPDFDEPGKRYAGEVANILLGMGCAVSCLDVDKLGLGKSDDVVDWLAAHPRAARSDIEALPRLAPNNVTASIVSGAYEAITMCAADIVPEPISWLWNGWLAAGKLHILAGAPGTGKTTLSLSLAATLSTAGRWPDGSSCTKPSNVLIWSGEDDPADTLVPRLNASGATLSRVHFLTGTRDTVTGEILAFDPSRDIPAIEDLAKRIGGVAMLIIDPIVSATGGADSHKNAEVRRALQPVVDMGRLLGCCILGITHFSKGTQGRDPTERVTGSLAFGALARVVLAAAKLSEDDGGGRLLCRTKSNIGLDHGGVKYDLLEKETDGGILSSYAAWGECVEGAARELLAQAEVLPEDADGESGSVADWLNELLREENGSIDRRDVMKAANAMGFKERTVHRARTKLGIVVKQHGFGKDKRSLWTWPDTPMPAIPSPIVPCVPHNLLGTHGTIGDEIEVDA